MHEPLLIALLMGIAVCALGLALFIQLQHEPAAPGFVEVWDLHT